MKLARTVATIIAIGIGGLAWIEHLKGKT